MVQTETKHLENFEELLDEFKKLPDRIERPPTFMEISGYPHYENVCSNILAFFMDPEEPHGFGTLVLDAIVGAANIAADEGLASNISVEREVSTEAGNRIDILIESDAKAILIENKIYAGANNPFDDYADYLDRIAASRAKHKILLTVFPTDEGSKWGFANLTYNEFLYTIRAMLGHYVAGADTRYLAMLLDFLNTLENLQKGTRMDREFVKFLEDRGGEVEDLLSKVKSFKDELRGKVQELRSLINIEEYQNVEQGFWRDKVKLLDLLSYESRLSENLTVVVITVIIPQGWFIQFFSGQEGDQSKWLRVRDLLESLDIPFEEGSRFQHPARFGYSEDLDRIRPVVQELVDKIATARVHQL